MGEGRRSCANTAPPLLLCLRVAGRRSPRLEAAI